MSSCFNVRFDFLNYEDPAVPQDIRFESTETTITIFWKEPEGYADAVVIEVPTTNQVQANRF